MFVSSCCDAEIPLDGIDLGICPECGEHCDVINEEEYEEETES